MRRIFITFCFLNNILQYSSGFSSERKYRIRFFSFRSDDLTRRSLQLQKNAEKETRANAKERDNFSDNI